MIKVFLILCSFLMMIGCVSTKLPNEDKQLSIRELLATQEEKTLSHHLSDTEHSAYSRNVLNETSNLFKTLPNPSLFLYIPAHVVANEIIVPGYTTVVKMYSKDMLALPGEQ